MTQIESIQKNIHEVKTELVKFRRMKPEDAMWEIFKQASIEECLKELKELRFCLNCAVKQLSK